MTRGRPHENEKSHDIWVHLRLREGVDDDLLTFFDQILPRKRSMKVKIALRSGGMITKSTGIIQTENVEEKLTTLADLLF